MGGPLTRQEGGRFRGIGRRAAWATAMTLIAYGIGASCTYMQPVSETSETGEIVVEVAIGDTVRVLTKQGDRPTFEVTDITEEALLGTDRRIPYDDMVFVERLTVSTIGTTVVVLSIVGSIVAVRAFEEGMEEAIQGAGERVLESIFDP